MKVFTSLLVFGVSLVCSAPSTLPSTLLTHQFGSDAVQVSRYIGPSNYPGYYIYNYLQIDHGRGIPVGIYDDGRSGINNLQPIYTHYGTPVYDYRFQVNQLYPGHPGYRPPTLIPSGQPSFVPVQGATFEPTTQRPLYEDDGIEKLDEKLDLSLEGNDNAHRDNDNDDTVTIDAI